MKYSLLSVGSIIGMIIAGFLILVGAIIYAFNDYYSSTPRPNFTAYESPVSLNGSSIVQRKAGFSTSGGIFQTRHPTYTQTYASGVTVSQSKLPETAQPITCETEQPTNYPAEMYTFSCIDADIKDIGQYVVVETYKSGTLEMIRGTVHINDTIMHVYIPETVQADFVDYKDWQGYFDVMEPIDIRPESDRIAERLYRFFVLWE